MSATTLYKALIEAKVSEETAEKAVEYLPVARDVATKSDIAEVRADIAGGRADTAEVRTEVAEGRADTAEVRAELKTDVAGVRNEVAEVRTEMAKLRTEMAQLEVRMVKWQVATNGAYAGLIIAAMGLMIKFWIL